MAPDLTDARAEVRRLSEDRADVCLAEMTAEGEGFLQKWLAGPGVSGWLGGRASAEARIRLASDSRTAIRRLVLLGREPIGYGQAADIGGGDVASGLPVGTWDCDLLIGATEHRGRGYGARALDLLVSEIFSTTLAPACSIAVPVRNERAVRGCEEIGFRWRQVVQDAVSGATWLMVRERPRS